MPRPGQLLEPIAPAPLVPRQVWAMLLFAPLAVWIFSPGIRQALSDSPHPDFRADQWMALLLDADAPTTGTVRLEGDWQRDRDGLSPVPGAERPAVVVHVPEGYWDRADLLVVGAPQSTWSVRLRRTTTDAQTGAPQIVSSMPLRELRNERRATIEGTGIPSPESGAPMLLSIEPRDMGRAAGGEFPLLRRVEVRFTSDLFNDTLHLPDVVAIALMPLLAGMLLRVAFGFRATRAAMGGLGIGLLLLVLKMRAPEGEGFAWGLAAGIAGAGAANSAFAAMGWRARSRRTVDASPAEWRTAAYALAVVALVLIALGTRWQAFDELRRVDLGWDASGYVQIAQKGGAPYATTQDFAPWVREPLFPWLLRAWFAVAPDAQASARFAALLLSVAAVAAVFAVGCRLFGPFVAIVAAGWLAFDRSWASMGVSVLRLDATVLLMMAAIAAATLPKVAENRRVAWVHPLALGAACAGLVLLRISALLFAAFAVAWEAARRRWHWHAVALAAAIIIVPLLPHLWFNYHYNDSGDPFYSSTVHSRYYLNRENIGRPGFPTTMSEYHADPYAGEAMGTAKYLFGHHTIPQLVAGHVRGYWTLFVWGSPRVQLFGGHEWLMLPGLLGFWVMVRRGKWWVLLWFVVAAFPYAFITSVHHAWRLGGEAHVVVLWIWALGVQQAAVWAWEHVRKKRGTESAEQAPA